jgi:hypothetical protein
MNNSPYGASFLIEPQEIRVNFNAENPFGAAAKIKKRELKLEAIKLKKKLGILAEKATRPDLDRAYNKFLKSANLSKVEGAQRLSYKLEIFDDSKLTNRDKIINCIFGLTRLGIANDVRELLRRDGFNSNYYDILALYRTEGNLTVLPSLKYMHLGILEDSPSDFSIIEQWPVPKNFITAHFTFHPEKVDPPLFVYKIFVNGVKSAVREHVKMVKDIQQKRKIEGYYSYEWLSNAKSGALSSYLLIVCGLDMYSVNIYALPEPYRYRPKKHFAYHYARTRIRATNQNNFESYFLQGEQKHDQMSFSSQKQFLTGQVYENSLVTAIYRANNGLRRHIFPYLPDAFVASILSESVMLFESYRRSSLIFGGKRFDQDTNNLLPSTLAYMRYHFWDIMFVVWVLDTIDTIINKNVKIPTKDGKAAKKALKNLKAALKEFKGQDKEEWNFLKKWRKIKNHKELLENWSNIKALGRDALDEVKKIPGPAEKTLGDELKQELGSGINIINKITENQLWKDIEKIMVAHIGIGGEPFIGNSPTITYGNFVGKNVLRFYMLREGYKKALSDI